MFSRVTFVAVCDLSKVFRVLVDSSPLLGFLVVDLVVLSVNEVVVAL